MRTLSHEREALREAWDKRNKELKQCSELQVRNDGCTLISLSTRSHRHTPPPHTITPHPLTHSLSTPSHIHSPPLTPSNSTPSHIHSPPLTPSHSTSSHIHSPPLTPSYSTPHTITPHLFTLHPSHHHTPPLIPSHSTPHPHSYSSEMLNRLTQPLADRKRSLLMRTWVRRSTALKNC